MIHMSRKESEPESAVKTTFDTANGVSLNRIESHFIRFYTCPIAYIFGFLAIERSALAYWVKKHKCTGGYHGRNLRYVLQHPTVFDETQLIKL